MQKIKLTISLLFVIVNLFGQTDGNKLIAKRLDDLYSTFFTKNGAGCATLISKNGKIIYEKGFGLADIEAEVAATSRHVFRIGSITKQFTAIVILQLYEQGKLDLKDEIQKYIPDFPISDKKITIENLLTHTSGIKNLTEIKDLEIKQTLYTSTELIALFKNQPLDFEPGKKYSYSNSGYILLGYIIEKVSGKTYADYITSNIFNKLGMKNSYYDNPTTIIKNRAKGYDLDTAYKLVNASFLNTSFPYSAGGLIMTVEDYYKWHQELLSNKLIKPETLRKAFTPFKVNDTTISQYGFGWAFRTLFGSKMIEHGGHINGFNSKESFLPQENILVVTFSNSSFVNLNILNDQAALIVAEKPQLKEISVAYSIMDKYIGIYKYSLDDPTTIKIYKDKGQLFFKVSDAPSAWKIHFVKTNEFVCYEAFPNTQILTKNLKGEVDGFIIKNYDYESKAIKVE